VDSDEFLISSFQTAAKWAAFTGSQPEMSVDEIGFNTCNAFRSDCWFIFFGSPIMTCTSSIGVAG
jgi:hypothetical protein